MRASISRHPDGSFHSGDRVYRLHQRDDHFEVVSAQDGRVVGGFSVAGNATELDSELVEPEIVRAIAELLSAPRGLLPLQ